MKKILKITLFSILAIIVLALAGLHISYTTFSPDDKGIPVNESNLVYFQETYEDSRQAFLAEARKTNSQSDQAEIFAVRVPCQENVELFIDFLYLPPADSTDKLLVLSSGVHGVEGFTGSAVQQMFMKELLSRDVLSEMGVLMIHSVNPWGQKYSSRITENNVDLNRGSGIDHNLFDNSNSGYTALYDMINPTEKVSTFSLRNQFFYLIALSKIMKASMGTVRQAIVQGQYEYPEGLFFGGNRFEPQIDSLKRILPGYFANYETILAIDLHTGYGERRTLHLFPMPVDDPEIKMKTESVFKGKEINWGDSDDFYTVSGSFAVEFLSRINPDAQYLYMIFEWGTFDSHKTFGSLKSLQKMINDNQGNHYGFKNGKHEQKIRKSNRELYYPDSEAWRSEVLESGRDMLSLVLETYPGIN